MAAIFRVTNSFFRPNDTTAYSVGDLVANSTTAGSVTPLSFSVGVGEFFILRARLVREQTTATNASFRLHLYSSSPAVANGDNGAFSSTESGWLGSVPLTQDVAVFSPFNSHCWGAAEVGTASYPYRMAVALGGGTTVYGLIEARAAYSPIFETFAVTLELERP